MYPAPPRRSLLKAGACLIAAHALPFRAAAAEPSADVTFVEDLDELWRTLDERYCFFAEKQTDWNAVRRLYRPQAVAADSLDAFGAVVSRTLRELYDGHTYLHDTSTEGARGPYFDLWIEPDGDGAARITSIREGSPAADAGVQAGDTVLAVDGRPVQRIAAETMPRCLTRPDPTALAFSLNIAVSGRRGQPRRLLLRRANRRVEDVHVSVKTPPTLPDVESAELPGGFGYIVIRSFADQAVVDAFDAALLKLRTSRGLVIDVRRNGGGDTAVARPIMGRFISSPMPYARMRRRLGQGLTAPWTEMVEARGPFTYTAPVAVLTSRWSASMAEGFPMGMRGLGRAAIIGTPMMQLGAAVFPIRPDRTGLEAQYSGEPIYDVHDHPRWLLQPDIRVPPGRDILDAGTNYLRSEIAKP